MKWVIPIALCAGPALADCPVASDLATGITVRTEQKIMTFVQLTGDDLQLKVIDIDDPTAYIYILRHGILVLQVSSELFVPAVQTSYSYDPAITQAIWPLVADQTITGPVAQTDAQERQPTQVEFSIVTTSRPDMEIGDCQYDAIDVARNFVRDDSTFTSVGTYLPELGILVLTGVRGPDLTYDFPPLDIFPERSVND